MSDVNEIREKIKSYRDGLSEEEILNLSREVEKKLYEIIRSSNLILVILHLHY